MERLVTTKELQERFKWMYTWDDAPEERRYDSWPISWDKRYEARDKLPDEYAWGWNNILNDLMEEIERVDKEKATVIFQIKEKFGGLRFYIEFRKDIDKVDARIINNCISRAESRSYQTCEVCGEHGKQRNTGWVKTLCDRHHDEQEENRRKWKERHDQERKSDS